MSTQARLLTGASLRGELGARAMVRLEPRTVTMYRVEWEYDGYQANFSIDADDVATEPMRRVRVKFFRNKGAAYNYMALRLIFAKRNQLATRIGDKGYPEGCKLCDALNARLSDWEKMQGTVEMCRYHDHGGEHFEQLRKRLARWLRWRDSRKKDGG